MEIKKKTKAQSQLFWLRLKSCLFKMNIHHLSRHLASIKNNLKMNEYNFIINKNDQTKKANAGRDLQLILMMFMVGNPNVTLILLRNHSPMTKWRLCKKEYVGTHFFLSFFLMTLFFHCWEEF